VAACKAHIAPTGETRELFELTACKANATKKLSSSVTRKCLQDRFKRLQGRFDKDNLAQRRMSVIGGEVTEIEELLSLMREDRNGIAAKRNAKREKKELRGKEKERLGAVIRAQATSRQGSEEQASTEGDYEDGSIEKGKRRPGSRVRKKRSTVVDVSDEVAFVEARHSSEESERE